MHLSSENQKKILFWTIETLIVVVLLFLFTQIQYVFDPIFKFVSVVFVPLVISGFLFYMLNPLVTLLAKIKIYKFRLGRTFASLVIVLLLVLIVVGGIALMVPTFIKESTSLVKSLPDVMKQVKDTVSDLSHTPLFEHLNVSTYMNKINSSLGDYAQTFLNGLSQSLGTVISTITSVTVVAITVPVMLFYMLKDGQKLVPSIQKLISPDHGDEVEELLTRMSSTLSHYISGQVIECLFVGVFTTIGYAIIQQPLALLLGIVAGMANMIPYVGPYIGITPALLVSITMAPSKIIWVIVIVVIVQQVDGNIIYPNIIGKTLKIHPLTIILLLLAAGNIAGIPGMILCIPFYAVIRTFVIYIWSIYKLNRG